MQVSIAAEQREKVIRGRWRVRYVRRRAVFFTRRGGLWFGTYHLLNYPANAAFRLRRSQRAGWYASRNAAFQERRRA